MADQKTALIVGGTSGIGLEVAKTLKGLGENVVITGRDKAKTKSVADEIGCGYLALDLTKPKDIGGRLAEIHRVDHLVIAAIDRDENTVRNFDTVKATQLATLKLVGYTEVIHSLLPVFSSDASIVLFGGLAKERPYPGSTMVTAVNGAVTSMVRTIAVEIAPIRVNAVHPGIVSDSPVWNGKPPEVLERIRVRTPTGKLPTMGDVASSTIFLLQNASVNGINLIVDGGWLLL